MKRCGRCGTHYNHSDFALLDVVQTLGASDLAPYVVGWPAGRVVDVRACARCKTPLARVAGLIPSPS